jgi:hypothetical protein
MDFGIVPAEYQESDYQRRRQTRNWLAAIAAIAMVVGASLALVTAGEVASPVAISISQ